MPSFAEIREGIAANLDTIPGLQASAYVLGNATPPAAEVEPGWGSESAISYDKAFQRGLDGYAFTVRVLVGNAHDIGAQKRLDKMIAPSGSSSVKAAVEANPTLSGAIDDLRVTECGGYRRYGNEGRVLGAEWKVQVWAEGSL